MNTTRPRTVTASVPVPQTQAQHLELRELLQSNLAALHALLEAHHRMVEHGLRAVDGLRAELRAELRAIGDARAPWVAALAETRALLYVALKEVIVGNDTAGDTIAMPQAELQRSLCS